MFKKTTFAQRTVKKASKWAKKNPKTAVAVGGGLIATTIGGIASSLTFGLKVRKLQNMVPQPQPAPTPAQLQEEPIEVTASSQQGDQKPIDVDDDEVTEPNESKDENEETEQETDETMTPKKTQPKKHQWNPMKILKDRKTNHERREENK